MSLVRRALQLAAAAYGMMPVPVVAILGLPVKPVKFMTLRGTKANRKA